MRGIAYEWFVSYLKNREQFVDIEYHDLNRRCLMNIRSQKQIVKNSIPQGSVLGCILFLLYINDLPKIIKHNSILYADDITVVFECNDSKDLKQQLHNALLSITDWLDDHNLKLNLDKTKLIHIRPRQKPPIETNFFYNNDKIETVSSCSLLGVEIDSEVNWKVHINKMTGKISRFAYALYQLKRCTNIKTAVTAYYAYAHSWLSYGIILWGNSSQVNELFVLQKKCIRILANINNRDSCRSHFRRLNILTLVSIYIYEICKFLRNHKDLFGRERDDHVRPNMRKRDKLVGSYNTSLKIVSAGTHHMAIKIYNKIPHSIKNIEKDIIFMNELNNYLLLHSFYNLQEFFNSDN